MSMCVGWEGLIYDCDGILELKLLVPSTYEEAMEVEIGSDFKVHTFASSSEVRNSRTSSTSFLNWIFVSFHENPTNFFLFNFTIAYIIIIIIIQLLEKLNEKRSSVNKQPYPAMYSSVFGGIILDPAMMVIPIDDHMVHRGHGVFDTAVLLNG